MAGYDGLVGSTSLPVMPVQQQDYTPLAAAVGELAKGVVGDGSLGDERKASARKNNAEAALKENELQGYQNLSDTVASLAPSPDWNKTGQQILSQAIKGGMKSKDAAEFLASVAASQGADNATLMRLRAGAGGSPLGKDDALTQDRQDQIRTEDFGQQTSIEGMQSADRRYSADSSAASSRYSTDQHTAAERYNTDQHIAAGDKAPKVNFGDLGHVDSEIDAQLGINAKAGTGPAISNDLRATLRRSAIANYRSGQDPATAVTQAIHENTGGTQKQGGMDLPLIGHVGGTDTVTPLPPISQATGAPAGPPVAAPSTAPPATAAPPLPGLKQGNDGQWYAPDPARPNKYLLWKPGNAAPAT